MTVLLVALLLLAVACGVSGLWIGYRNPRVHAFRTALIRDARIACEADIERGRPWRWRYEAFSAVSYDAMIRRFWKPLRSFYPSYDFCDPACHPDHPVIDVDSREQR